MKVSLNIENDEELRLYIKECIRGQVLSIVRDEFIEVVKSEINRKVSLIGTRDFDYLQKEAFEAAAKQILSKNHGINDWDNSFVKPLLTEILTKKINAAIANTNWKSIVDTLAKEKVKALIQ